MDANSCKSENDVFKKKLTCLLGLENRLNPMLDMLLALKFTFVQR